jgi:hypothetical protein
MIDEKRRTELFVQLYTDALRALTKNDFLQEPKEGSEKWLQLEAARKLVDDMGGEYGDYIMCQFEACQHVKVVCKPHHLCSTKAVERYLRFQKKKNKYHKQSYSVDGDYLIVQATNRTYPLSQVDLGVKDDPDANHAQYIVSNDLKIDEKDRPKAIEEIEYLICKLRYKEKHPTEPMVRKLKELYDHSR